MFGSRKILWAALGAISLIAAAVVVSVVVSGEEEARAAIRFEGPTDQGPNPFTPPGDRPGRSSVDVGSGPFGGSGSDLVCDRELLIRSLRARPDRLREWARVVGIQPDFRTVANYIRTLRPVTLTRDTRITNHSFVDGKASPYQAILQAGTAVLVDKHGQPVARCRCGNPLTREVSIPEATCLGCPPNYEPPPPCRPYARCWRPYPDPPPAKPPTGGPGQTPAGEPSASFSPSAGRPGDTFTLSVSGFAPKHTLRVTLQRPDGQTEEYSITTDEGGAGQHVFSSSPNDLTGTYTATVTDPESGQEARASVQVSGPVIPPEQQQGGGEQVIPPSETPPGEQVRPGGELPPEQGGVP